MTARLALTLILTLAGCSIALADEPADLARSIIDASGVDGGLCVLVGVTDGHLAAALSDGGRLLVHGLATGEVEGARRRLHEEGLYGLVSVEQVTRPQLTSGRLPYADNLVNLLVVQDPQGFLSVLADGLRALAPGGAGMVWVESRETPLGQALAGAQVPGANVRILSNGYARIEKLRPEGMDEWGHPRHAADGNAVSEDQLAGPPRRVRWLNGPFSGVGDMVTAEGRNYYSNLMVRDSFNGLPIWQGHRGADGWTGDAFPAKPGSVPAVAAGERLYVVNRGLLTAVDGATGAALQTYPAAGEPCEFLVHDGIIVATNWTSVRAVDAETGDHLWTRGCTDPGTVVIGDGAIFMTEGSVRRGEGRRALRLDPETGKEQWRIKAQQYKSEDDTSAWLLRATAAVYHDGLLVFEVSSYTDFGEDNGVYAVSATDGSFLWSHNLDGMSHWKQARLVFLDGRPAVLNGQSVEVLDPGTGEVTGTHEAFGGHCFPPVGLRGMFLSGEMSLTDITSGIVDSHRITKGACSRNGGIVPANGLLYTSPKGCACWPMLHGVVAMAPARAGGPLRLEPRTVRHLSPLDPPPSIEASESDWPAYRRDASRGAATSESVPAELDTLWTAEMPSRAESRFLADWERNPFVRGPVTGPVVAQGFVVVAQPDAHRVVGLDAETGEERWSFTAEGRIDSPPTLHRGLCLFGSRAGRVYCLRLRDGRPVWELHLAPAEERIVVSSQLESPWPVAGSVLADGDTVYFAAGRQYLADGGIRVFAVDPWQGSARWSGLVSDLPDFRYYAGAGLEFDGCDLMVRERDGVSMSRWLFDAETGEMTLKAESGFARLDGVMAPRGLWTYGTRQFYGGTSRITRRPLAAFRGSSFFGCTADGRGLFRRDFTPESLDEFDDNWYANRDRIAAERSGEGDTSRQQRLMRGATWTADVFGDDQESIGAVVLAGDTLFVVGVKGRLLAYSAKTGEKLAERDLPPLVWDGLIAANGRLYATTVSGSVICLG